MKMFKNNKGFTLVELLAVILILGALAIIAMPSITKYFAKSNEEIRNTLEKNLELAAKDYVIDNEEDVSYVSVITLMQHHYLSEKIIMKGKEDCSDSYVFIDKGNYSACLVCDGKLVSNHKNCQSSFDFRK